MGSYFPSDTNLHMRVENEKVLYDINILPSYTALPYRYGKGRCTMYHIVAPCIKSDTLIDPGNRTSGSPHLVVCNCENAEKDQRMKSDLYVKVRSDGIR